MSAPLPGIPSRSGDLESRIRDMERQLAELRARDFQLNNLRGVDSLGNELFAADTQGAQWGIAMPRQQAPLYPVIPDQAMSGYTYVPLLASSVIPTSQQINVAVKYSVQEIVATGTSQGEFEIRWAPAMGAITPRTDPLSTLIKYWNTSYLPGTHGLDGAYFDLAEYIWPSSVVFGDIIGVTVTVWARVRPATGNAADVIRVSPLWSYQGGWGQG